MLYGEAYLVTEIEALADSAVLGLWEAIEHQVRAQL